MPPMSVTCCCDSISEMTGVVALGRELRASWLSAQAADVAGELDDRRSACRGRCRRTAGRSRARARIASTMPSTPRTPKPPGHEQPVDAARGSSPRRVLVGEVGRSTATAMSTPTSFAMPPWISASWTDLVGCRAVGVLADDGDPDALVRVRGSRSTMLAPGGEVGRLASRAEAAGSTFSSKPCSWKRERDLVDRLHVRALDHAAEVHVAEERDLALDVGGERALGAADQDVGLDSDLHQLAHRVLRRLGLELARGGDVRHQREVDEDRVLAADLLAELADRLEERQRLDVADGAADLDDHDVVSRARCGGWRS